MVAAICSLAVCTLHFTCIILAATRRSFVHSHKHSDCSTRQIAMSGRGRGGRGRGGGRYTAAQFQGTGRGWAKAGWALEPMELSEQAYRR
jgi:hypothetical protein